jgi:hypothetical protein
VISPMSDATLGMIVVAFLASLAPTLTALAALRQSHRIAVKAEATDVKIADNTMKTEAIALKTDTIIEKAVEIHSLTNSNLTKVSAALEVALARIEGLQNMVTELVKAKAVADEVQKRGDATRDTMVKAAESVRETVPGPVPVEIVNDPLIVTDATPPKRKVT